MPTVVDIIVAPSGGDYTLLSVALASIPSNITPAGTDEQYNVKCRTFSGGLNESITFPSVTQSATNFVHVMADSGHEYIPHTGAGFFLHDSVGFSGVFTNSVNFTKLSGFGVMNTRTLANGRGIDNFGSDNEIFNLYARTDSSAGAIVYFLNNANNLSIYECLAEDGTTGFDFGNNFTRNADKLTAVNQSNVGIDTGTANTVLTNSLSIGATDPYLGTFDTGTSNNASSSTDAPGTNPQNNRTTSDFADYANGDFRTASGSTLATAGVGGTFIGYELEASASNNDASISSDMPSMQSSVSASQSAPGSNASISSQMPSMTSSMSASVLAPNFDSSISSTMPSMVSSVQIAIQSPGYNAAVASVMPSMQSSLSASVTVPSYSASITATMPSMQSSAQVSHFLQGNSVIISSQMPSMSSSVTANQTIPEFSVSILSTMPSMVSSVEAQHFTPGINASIVSQMPSMISSVQLNVQEPVNLIATITSTMPSMQSSVSMVVGDVQPIGQFDIRFAENNISVEYALSNIILRYEEL